MQNKLDVLFEQIKLEDEEKIHFKKSKLKKVMVNTKHNSWTFLVSIDKLLPVEVYDKVNELIVNAFKNIKKAYFCIEPKKINYDLVNEYWNYTVGHIQKDSAMLSIFRDREVLYKDNKLLIEVYNKAEFNKLDKKKGQIKRMYSRYGFNDIEVKININKELGEKVKHEINLELKQGNTKDLTKDLEKLKIKENKVIYGKEIKRKPTIIKNVVTEGNNIVIEGYVFDVEYFESNKSNVKIITLKITDYTDSMYIKLFPKGEEFKRLSGILKAGQWLKVSGYTKNDAYAKDIVLMAQNINAFSHEEEIDDAEEKRVELHAHTFMSKMDGVIDVKKLIKRAKTWGHKAIAITDHNCLQSYPDAFHNEKGIKIIYGVELTLVDDEIDIVVRETNNSLIDTTYVVFDFETTGFNAGGGDSIIEVGAVKIEHGEIIDRFSELIDPGKKLSEKITEITGIKDSDLKGKDTEEEVLKRFIKWFGNFPMVAHNAKFDASFLERGYSKYNLGEYKNTLIDTLQLSRVLDPSAGRHGLSYLVKRYNVPFDEDSHHRADYDAEGTALVFHKMIQKMIDRNLEKISDMKGLIAKEDIHKIGRGYHIILLVQNDIGLKNIFRLVSLANTKYFYKGARILRSEIEKNREGLLIGSCCAEGEVFNEARIKGEEELVNIINFYDYIEVQPLEVYNHLLQMGNFANEEELKDNIKKMIRVSNEAGKLVCATGDVHHLDRKDKVYREIIVNQKVPGGGRHPLARKNITEIPSCHFRTTNEMLENFDYLGKDVAKELVIDNPNKIVDMIGEVKVIKGELCTPKMKNSDKIVTDIVHKTAKELYGKNLPEIVDARIKQELDSIIGHNFDVIYLIAEKLVKKSNEDGYIVGSRGSIGSSFAATLLGITEVNPLPAHYLCPKCKKTIFEIDGESLGKTYPSGYDLPDLECECGTKFKKEGQDMPFATFLGFKGDKIPDIDLNFSGDYQSKAHDYTRVLFGADKVFRAGTMTTVAAKTAYGFTLGYCEDRNIILRGAEIDRLALGCTGVKRTTGQHPGGIVVIPKDKDILDFTPYQYPADDINAEWYTTHFEYHALEDDILKLDILGHDDPTMLRMLQDLSGVDIKSIPFDDPDVLSIFSSPDILGVTKEQIMCETGTLGVPEFGTKFVIGMLEDTRPKNFAELVKISGLSHGTDVWLNNAQSLVRNKVCEFKDVIGCRDDIMIYLMNQGLERLDAFQIMEFVRRGTLHWKGDLDTWNKFENIMQDNNIPQWYIESCQAIKYMFPKAHATAYVMMGFRVAWFKVHYPIFYYAAYFSIRSHDFDIKTMIKGYDDIKNKIIEITNKGYDATQKEQALQGVLEIALEFTARGFKFGNIDLYKSDSSKFIIDEDNKTLIPPFRTLDGLGDTVAKNIVEKRKVKEFVSIEDFQKQCKASMTIVDKMRVMGIFGDLPESSQLSLF